ncbi:GGDEF domain-containing protein [Micromonospora sp. STR1s_5]|nr:GGDEF domain-containing protein [Micromonospora sp. STR1s_5]
MTINGLQDGGHCGELHPAAMYPKHKTREILVSALVAASTFVLATRCAFFERLFEWAARRDSWRELDAGLALLVCASSWAIFLSLRRAQQLRQEIERREAAELLAHQAARLDSLTGLPNGLGFSEAVATALSDAREYAVLFVDLDGFKPVNDTHGHGVGDILLVEVGNRLSSILPEAKLVARLGGDEFGLLVELAGRGQTPNLLARKVKDAFRVPFTINGTTIPIDLTIGTAMTTDGYEKAPDVVRAADLDMYEQKRSRRPGKGRAA